MNNLWHFTFDKKTIATLKCVTTYLYTSLICITRKSLDHGQGFFNAKKTDSNQFGENN